MAQKNVSFKLGNAGVDGKCKVYLRVTGGGTDIKLPTKVRLAAENFKNGSAVKLHNKKDLNELLSGHKKKIESILEAAWYSGSEVTREMLTGNGRDGKLSDMIDKYLDETRSKGTKRGRRSVLNKIRDMELTDTLLLDFEKSINGLDQNTINTQTKRVKTFLSKMIRDELITDPKIIKAVASYRPPKYIQKLPEFLSVEEIKKIEAVIMNLGNPQKRTAGYYFLLSCYTGWRLSDLMGFDYKRRVKAGNVMLRAGKNNKIVSILIYPALARVLQYCKENKLNMTEQHFRLFVKQIASDIGISHVSRNIKIHTGRHTFAMMLIDKGFNLDEVAELLGDTKEVAAVYGRITNEHLNKKVKERLF